MATRFLAYLRGLMRRRAVAAEVDDELRFHVEQEVEANIARGMSPSEARRAALRDLGGLTQTREAVGDVRTIWLDLAWRDIRHAVRALAGAPAFSAVALLILILSIGASTAIYSVIDAVILRGLPVRPERSAHGGRRAQHQGLVADARRTGSRRRTTSTGGRSRTSSRGSRRSTTSSISLKREGQADPEILRAQMVTVGVLLRAARRADDRPCLHHRSTRSTAAPAWRSSATACGSDGLAGRRTCSTRPLPGQLGDFEILGVMPPAFAYPVGATPPTEVWVPYVPSRGRPRARQFRSATTCRSSGGCATASRSRRRRRGWIRSPPASPRRRRDGSPIASPRSSRLRESVTRGVRTWMWLLLGAVTFVMLIACVNLANLMLVRATTRTRELAIRGALGASRWDLSRTLLAESLMLSLVGAAFGVLRRVDRRRTAPLGDAARRPSRGHDCRQPSRPGHDGDRRDRDRPGRSAWRRSGSSPARARPARSISVSARRRRAPARSGCARGSSSPRSRSRSCSSSARACSSRASSACRRSTSASTVATS